MDVDLQRCIRGEKRAWDAFVGRVAPIVHAAVRRTLRRHHAAADSADDVVQEVFLRLIRNDLHLLRTFDPARASLATWLTLVARSTTIDHLRRTRPPAVPIEQAREAAVPAPPTPSEGATRELGVPDDLLPPRQRLVVHLLFDRGLSVDEAGELMGVSPQTVRSTKHKALERLREFFRRR